MLVISRSWYMLSIFYRRILKDQLLTQDVEKFCNTMTDLYSNLTKVEITTG